jgi:hypothetical protein
MRWRRRKSETRQILFVYFLFFACLKILPIAR